MNNTEFIIFSGFAGLASRYFLNHNQEANTKLGMLIGFSEGVVMGTLVGMLFEDVGMVHAIGSGAIGAFSLDKILSV